MSATFNRLLNSQNLAQIVPENKNVLAPSAQVTDSPDYYLYVALGAAIIIGLIIFFVLFRHRRRHYRYHS